MTHDEIMGTTGQHQSSTLLRKWIDEGAQCVHLEVCGEGDAGYSIIEFASGTAAVFGNGDPEYYRDLEEAHFARGGGERGMTLREARQLRDEIREAGVHCTVPTGYGPDGYFAQIGGLNGPVGTGTPERIRFHSRSEWEQYRQQMERDLAPPRAPIEIMIDRACGL